MPTSILRTTVAFSVLSLLAIAGCATQSGDGDVPDVDMQGVSTLAPAPTIPGTTPLPPPSFPLPTLTVNAVTGKMMCRARDGATTRLEPLAELPIDVGPGRVTTQMDGTFNATGTFALGVNIRAVYDGPIDRTGLATQLQIMDDVKNTRTESRTFYGSIVSTKAGRVLDLGNVELSSLDCDLWRMGGMVLRDYHVARGARPPAGKLRIQRWSDLRVATHTFYDYINVSPDFADSHTTFFSREHTIFHEFGHSVRHVADGPEHHWSWDNFRWAYARAHTGEEIFNTQYAFNEGWAAYWARTRYAPAPYASPYDSRYTPWVENRIGNRLFDDARRPGSSDRVMVEVLEAHPGAIHSLFEFETHLFARLGLPAPPAPPSCPPGYTDDGATCRSGGDVVPKPSYGRGVGSTPTVCGAGNELDAGLCYPNCAAGYDGVGPVCWQNCPAGYNDDGASCRRDGSIIGSDNSRCPDIDKCGLFTNPRCSVCPAGYQNDGCTCRIDPHIFFKSSYGRGVGWVPTSCASGQDYDAGLCYAPCRAGFHGVGPVCWGSCPAGYDDDGALCRRPLSILVKY